MGAILISSMMISLTASAFEGSDNTIPESEVEVADTNSSLVGVHPAPVSRGTAAPTETWNFEIKGKYSVSGDSSAGKDLYTDYRFAGAASGIYTIYLNNKFHYKLVAKVCRASDGKELKTFKVAVGESATFTYETSHVWYLKICGSSKFDGYIDG
jgi:hypothetical protein